MVPSFPPEVDFSTIGPGELALLRMLAGTMIASALFGLGIIVWVLVSICNGTYFGDE